jgi:hypothetical protein
MEGGREEKSLSPEAPRSSLPPRPHPGKSGPQEPPGPLMSAEPIRRLGSPPRRHKDVRIFNLTSPPFPPPVALLAGRIESREARVGTVGLDT